MSAKLPKEPPTLIPHEKREALKAAWMLAQESERPSDVCVVKLFDPSGRYTYYAFEGYDRDDGEFILYGYCVSPLGPDCDEWGYTALSEIEDVTNRFGLKIERDLHFRGITRADIEAGKRP
jgi:hypothetical protein